MEENQAHPKNPSFDIKNYILKLIAHWYLFAIALIIGIGYDFVDSRFAKSRYSVYTTMLLSDELQNTQAVVGALNIFDNRKNYENEFGVLKSYALNEAAIKELDFTITYFRDENFRSDKDLYKYSPFIVVLDTTKNQTDWLQFNIRIISDKEYLLWCKSKDFEKKMNFGQEFNTDYMNFKIIKNEKISPDLSQLAGNEYYFYKNNFNSLVKEYQSSLNVDLRSPNSSILWLWIEGSVPERIVDYLNKLSEVYLKQSLDAKNRIVYNTMKFIDSQLSGVIDSLDDVEDKLQLFKQNNQVLDIGKEGEMLFNELDNLQNEKKLIEIKRSFYEYFMNDFNENGELTTGISPSFLNIQDPVLEELLSEFLKSKKEIELLNYDIKKDVPTLDKAKLKSSSIQKDLKTHVTTSLKAISHNYDVINKKIELIDSKLRQIPSVEREIQNINRKYKLNDNIYTFLLEKRTEAGITMASNSPGAKILDVAKYEDVIDKTPEHGENRTKIIFISLLVPVLIIIMKDFFNNKIIDKSDVEKGCQVPIIGSVSRNIRNEELPVFIYPKSPVAESFRLVKTNLQYLIIDIKSPVISVNSTISGEGKTFCSANIAALYASNNKKTLIIGLDLRKPKTHLLFENPNITGLSTYLVGYNTLEEVIFKTNVENLFLLPAGPIPPNPAELLESDKMIQLIADLKSVYDYIVIDTPPIAHVADALLIAKFTDANIFVIRQNYSSKNVVRIVEDLRSTKKMKHMGILINDVNPSVIFGLKFGYGFSYGYSYGYGYEEGQGYYDNYKLKSGLVKQLVQKFFAWLKKILS
ncbi:MAG: polysaccharide biosynthesis tyrosine autokinase [Bacteroidales bacterium]